jgi:hypothetical protein
MNRKTATRTVLLAAAFVAATLQGSRLPQHAPWEGAVTAGAVTDKQRACTPTDEQSDSGCKSERMWA